MAQQRLLLDSAQTKTIVDAIRGGATKWPQIETVMLKIPGITRGNALAQFQLAIEKFFDELKLTGDDMDKVFSLMTKMFVLNSPLKEKLNYVWKEKFGITSNLKFPVLQSVLSEETTVTASADKFTIEIPVEVLGDLQEIPEGYEIATNAASKIEWQLELVYRPWGISDMNKICPDQKIKIKVENSEDSFDSKEVSIELKDVQIRQETTTYKESVNPQRLEFFKGAWSLVF